MEMIFNDYIYQSKTINLTIKHNTITGITGEHLESLLNLISLRTTGKGELKINDIKITQENLKVFRKRIGYVKENMEIEKYYQKVLDLLIKEVKDKNLEFSDAGKKINDSLKIVGLSEEYLNRGINTLSVLEKKLVQIAIELLSNSNVLVLNEPFKGIDLKNEKKLMNLFLKIKEQYNKTIIIASNNSNLLYKYTTEMIFIKNGEVLLQGPTNETYLRVDFLKRNKINIPEIVEFTYLAKKNKKVKIDYHKDIRDIIKDIYKHV